MNNKITSLLATSAVALITSQAAVAGPNLGGVTIEKVGYAGNGCPGGSASVVLAPDKQSVSVLFDEYIAEAGGQGQRTFDRKKCDIAFGLKIPNGISVAMIDADYRGFADLPRNARATFKRSYFFAGAQGANLTKHIRGGQSNDFIVKDRMGVMANVWSACGEDVILRSKTAATVRTQRGHEALMMVDSADLKTQTTFRYNFRYRTCK